MAWNLTGSYVETCSCELMCPCNLSLDHGATYDFCRVTLVFNIREGAIEGTDLAILRAGELSGKTGFVVVKVAKPGQDMRFDVPTVGTDTIESMRASGARVLAIEAGKTILLDEAKTVALADRYGIAITALREKAA